jgi:hypothetical protein
MRSALASGQGVCAGGSIECTAYCVKKKRMSCEGTHVPLMRSVGMGGGRGGGTCYIRKATIRAHRLSLEVGFRLRRKDVLVSEYT